MAKLRHIAFATNDPDATAEFYKKAFDFKETGRTHPDNPLATGVFLSDGTLNIAILKFSKDQLGKGLDFVGLHHFGVLVDDAQATAAKLESLGAQCFLKQDERKPATQVPGTVFEIKFRGPDGVVFDIADTVWKGAAPEHADATGSK